MIKKDKPTIEEPEWLDPSNDRKKPYTDEQLDLFVEDFIANMSDVQAWTDLIDDVGKTEARRILKERIVAQDPMNLANWDPFGPAN